MGKLEFGKQLRAFRQQSEDRETGRALTQRRLGRLLGDQMGDYGFSGTAISDWERGKSAISADDRMILISLIKILKRCGGVKSLEAANLLLEAGNYRALDVTERKDIYPERAPGSISSTHIKERGQNSETLLSGLFVELQMEFQNILAEARAGPSPVWPRVIVACVNRVQSQLSILHIIKGLGWLWIWWITYLLIAPSLQWQFGSNERALQAMVMFAAGIIILPACIGAFVNTKDDEFWKSENISNSLVTRLYVYQGAYIGFQVGYFILLPISLFQKQLWLRTYVLAEFLKMLMPIFIGFAGAHLVPHNLLRAYKRLDLRDGAIFFIFIFLGPLWAWFVLQYMAYIKIFTLLAALTLLAIVGLVRYQIQKARR